MNKKSLILTEFLIYFPAMCLSFIFIVRYCMRTEKAHFTVKSSKTTVSGIFRATKNLILALNPLCTLNVKITLLYESGRYR